MTAKKEKKLSEKVLILGAGLTGLSAAYKLKRFGFKNILILEEKEIPGGLLKTNRREGGAIDELPHVFFSKDKTAKNFFLKMVGKVYKHSHNLGVLWNKGYIDYPFQNNIHQLEIEERKKVLKDLIERKPFKDCRVKNLEDFAIKNLGREVTELFFRPYNEKLWLMPLKKMDYKWLSSKIKMLESRDIVESVLGKGKKKNKDVAPHAEFIYPKKGGIETLVDGLVANVGSDKIKLKIKITKIDAKKKMVFAGKEVFSYDKIISTLPLTEAVRMAGVKKNAGILKRLRATKVFCVQYVLKKVNLPNYHWIYVPSKELPFYRMTRVDLLNPKAFKDKKVLLVECAISESDFPNGKFFIKKITSHLEKLGVFKRKDIMRTWHSEHFPAYPVPHFKGEKDIAFCLKELLKKQIISAGRSGEWFIKNMDHSILAGFKAAEEISKR
jgi:protoporphyrinogen oxidase